MIMPLGMRIAFITNQLSLRGTEVALFNFAAANENILGNESIIVDPPDSIVDGQTVRLARAQDQPRPSREMTGQ